MRRWNVALGISLVTLGIAACGPETAPSTSIDPAFALLMDQYIGEARASGASEAQLAALTDARATGDISYEVLNAAIEETFACFNEAGVRYRQDTDNTQALPLIVYEFASPIEGNPVADACIDKNSFFVESAYQNQPRWRAVLDGRIEANRGEILACLRERGIEIDDDATPAEITESTRLSLEEVRKYLDAGSEEPFMCLVAHNAY